MPVAATRVEFLRGENFTLLDAPPAERGSLVLTRVVSPLPAAVVGRLAKWGKRPFDSELVTVRVPPGAPATVELKCGAGTASLEMEEDDGDLYSKKKLLCWYGAAADLGDTSAWDEEIVLLDVSKSGDVPLELLVEADCGGVKGLLGLIDVLIEDPEAEGTWRSARHGVFQTGVPRLKFILPRLAPEGVTVMLDDGDEATDDELNITEYIALAGEVTAVPEPAAYIDLEAGEGGITGTVNTVRGRVRLVPEWVTDHEPEARCALFMWGENRIQLRACPEPTLPPELIFSAPFLLYQSDEETIPAWSHDTEVFVHEDVSWKVVKDSLSLDFIDSATDAQVSEVLHALRLRPVSFCGSFNIVEGRTLLRTLGPELAALWKDIEEREEERLESLCMTVDGLHDDDGDVLLERMPEGVFNDFVGRNPATHPTNAFSSQHHFVNAFLCWHHFVIHTFPALRLIEHTIMPSTTPPVVSLAGLELAPDKTYVRRSARDSIRRIVELSNQDTARKLAIFGHTNTDATPASATDVLGLSIRRARVLKALLLHRMATFIARFTGWDAAQPAAAPPASPHARWVLVLFRDLAGTMEGAPAAGAADDGAYVTACEQFMQREFGGRPADVSTYLGHRDTRLDKFDTAAVERAVDDLHRAMDCVGTDEDAIYASLEGKSAFIRERIELRFNAKYARQWSTLRRAFAEELSGDDLTRATRALDLDRGPAAIQRGLYTVGRERVHARVVARVGADAGVLEHETLWGAEELDDMLRAAGDLADGAATAETRANAIRALQRRHNLCLTGRANTETRVCLVAAYQKALVPEALDEDRFHADAAWGCADAYLRIPGGSPQNHRVEVIFRQTFVPTPAGASGANVPYRQWVQQDLAASPPAIPRVVVAFNDSGFGGGENLSAVETRTQESYLHYKGERLIRPTDVSSASAANLAAAVAADGDIRGVRDDGGNHGTGVMTCFGADGRGTLPFGTTGQAGRRSMSNLVQGTAPHVFLRPIRANINFFSLMLALEVMASDDEVLVHGTSSHAYRTGMSTVHQWNAMDERIKNMLSRGKVAIASAGNYRFQYPNEYDTATRMWGRNAPDRRTPRKDYTGADEHRSKVLIVGSSHAVGQFAGADLTMSTADDGGIFTPPGTPERIADHTYMGEQVGIHMPGMFIRVVGSATRVATPAALTGSISRPNGTGTTFSTSGTSFATPMTTGVVAELMLLDADLRLPANVARTLEYVEATADPLIDALPGGGQTTVPPGHMNDSPAASVVVARNADPGASTALPVTFIRVPAWNAAAGVGPGAGVPPQGPADPINASTFTNLRRVNYWKAVLTALNKGLCSFGHPTAAVPTGARTVAGGKDSHFKLCDIKDAAAVTWYGLELRTWVANAQVWFRVRDGGRYVSANDAGAVEPGDRTTAVSWRSCDRYKKEPIAPGVAASAFSGQAWANTPPNAVGQLLPAYPWGTSELVNAGRIPLYLCQLSIEREQLEKMDELLITLPTIDPRAPDDAGVPHVLKLPLDLPKMRDKSTAPSAAPNDYGDLLATVLESYNNFVFHLTVSPEPLTSFKLRVEGNRTALAVGEAREVELFCLDRFGHLTDDHTAPNWRAGAITLASTVTHNGTAGVAAPPSGVHFDGAPCPQAGPPMSITGTFGTLNVVTGTFHPRGIGRFEFTGFTQENVTLTFTDAGRTGSLTIPVAAAGAVDHFTITLRRPGGGASLETQPPRTAEQLEAVVQAVDAQGRLVTAFTDPVELAVVQGQVGSDGPPKAGVHAKAAEADPYAAAAFTQPCVAGERLFSIFNYTPGMVQLEARRNGTVGQSQPLEFQSASGLASFRIQAASPQTVGTPFEVAVEALDATGNRITDFEGAVRVRVKPNTATDTFGTATAANVGTHVEGTQGAADDTYTFTHAEGGVHSFHVTIHPPVSRTVAQINAISNANRRAGLAHIVSNAGTLNPGGLAVTAGANVRFVGGAWTLANEVVTLEARHAPTVGPAIATDSPPIEVQAAGAISKFGFEFTGAGPAGTRFDVKVMAQDAAGTTVEPFRGAVTFGFDPALAGGSATVAQITALGVPAGGTTRIMTAAGNIGTAPNQIAVRVGDLVRFDGTRWSVDGRLANTTHTYAAADRGAFVFQVTPNRAMQHRFVATAGAVSTTSPNQAVRNAPIHHLRIAHPAIQRNVAVNISVFVEDAAGNAVTDFAGAVRLLHRSAPAAAFVQVGAPYNFTAADAGRHDFNITIATAGGGQILYATDGGDNPPGFVPTAAAPYFVSTGGTAVSWSDDPFNGTSASSRQPAPTPAFTVAP